jgi:3'-phosphoadenosine 5'-phosphosulfate sulfotransferase (PAPS reductase)/FAD synthetase
MNIAEQYDKQVCIEKDRADKDIRYAHFYAHKQTDLKTKERWSIDLIKMALNRAKKPVLSCSFGIDSMIDIYLTRKALVELGRDPSDVDVVWNDTANEFREVREYQRYITDLWKLRLTITKPKKTLKHVIDKNGGVTSEYFFAAKNDTKNGKPLSQKCCNTLKHEPMKRVMKENNWDLLIVGLRADESRQRLQAGLRDGEYFYSRREWKAYMLRPILWWTDEDVWQYVEQEKIPFNDLYHKNLVKNTGEIVDRQTAITLEKQKVDVFMPRTGCMMCPIPVKYGYLQWMRLNYEKVYNTMIYNLGYGDVLMNMIPNDVREEIETLLGITITPENIHEYLKDILDAKPCTFDRF